jgi:hypothetical protein
MEITGTVPEPRQLSSFGVLCVVVKRCPIWRRAWMQRRRSISGTCSRPADAMFNLGLLLQRQDQYAEAADYWRRYLANDCQSEWAARARRSLKFCEMQVRLTASATI